MKPNYRDFVQPPEVLANLRTLGLKIQFPTCYQPMPITDKALTNAVKAYLDLKSPKRGDLKRVAISHGVHAHSILTRINRMKLAKPPSIYKCK